MSEHNGPDDARAADADAVIAVPHASQTVCKDECLLCFDSPDSDAGIDVCMTCFAAGCCDGDAHRSHAALHSKRSGHAYFANIRRTPKPRKPLTKLAIAEEADEDLYEYVYTPKVYTDGDLQGRVLPRTTKIDEVIAGIQRATSSAHASDVRAWEEELVPCAHTKELVQPGGPRRLDLADARCAECGLESNLWLCLTCGHLGCGRAQFGGVSGNSHGLSHFEETGHPCSVKQGTITAEGAADLYCYACNDARLDPDLAKHLHHFGLNVMEMNKTEKSMTEMQLEQNAKFDFSMTSDDGTTPVPLFGAGLTGIKNLGNSCYLASVMQSLFAMPEFQKRYLTYFDRHTNACTKSPADCLECQFGKLADGLLSGRYAKPRRVASGDEEKNGSVFQDGVRPTMFKALVGKGNMEFASMRQQDADEFLKYLVGVVQAEDKRVDSQPAGAPVPLGDPTSVFAYTLEHRLQCLTCSRVRYTLETQDVGLGLPVPVRHRDVEDASGPSQFEPVSLEESLDLFTRAEELDYHCPACAKQVTAVKQTLFASLPKVLAVQAQRFQLINWVPQKVDVPFLVPLEGPLDLRPYLSKGQQDGEEPLPDDSAPESAPQEFDENALMMLTSMGFSENRAKRALLATGNTGDTEVAANWLFEHMDEDLDGPLGPTPSAPPPVDTSMLEEMGFTRKQAAKALRVNGGNAEIAVSWLFENPDDDGEEDAAPDGAPQQTRAVGSREHTAYRISTFVSHRGPSVHSGHYVAHIHEKAGDPRSDWVFFNDEKVVQATFKAASSDPIQTSTIDASVENLSRLAYLYFFTREDGEQKGRSS